MVFRVIENQLRKCFMLFNGESYVEILLNCVEVGCEPFDEIDLFPRQPIVIDDLPWRRHDLLPPLHDNAPNFVCCCHISSHRIFISCHVGDYGCNDARMKRRPSRPG